MANGICCRCKTAQARPGQSTCQPCATIAQRERRSRIYAIHGTPLDPTKLPGCPLDESLYGQLVWFESQFLKLADESKHVWERAHCLKLALGAALEAAKHKPRKLSMDPGDVAFRELLGPTDDA
jgi:hypothetical protein